MNHKDAAWEEFFRSRKELLRCSANCIATDFAPDDSPEPVVNGEIEVGTVFDDALYVAADSYVSAMRKVMLIT